MAIRGGYILILLACACTKTSEPPAPEHRTPAPPQSQSDPPPAADPDPDPSPQLDPSCAQVDIRRDQRALPLGSDAQAIFYFTHGQAEAFEDLAPEGVSVELSVATGGVATFDARVRSQTKTDALDHCRAMVEAFMPTVPGHPRTDEPGGSVITDCRPCQETRSPAGLIGSTPRDESPISRTRSNAPCWPARVSAQPVHPADSARPRAPAPPPRPRARTRRCCATSCPRPSARPSAATSCSAPCRAPACPPSASR